jgi:hypothetical protein
MLLTTRKLRSSLFRSPGGASSVLVLMIVLSSTLGFANNIDTQSYIGTAYGTSAFVGNTVLVGQTAPVTLGGTCGTSQQPLNVPGSAAGTNLPPLVTGGAVNTDVSSSPQTAQATANTAAITLLGGLITAQAIKAVSTTTLQSNGTFQVSSAGSTFNNLVIVGHVYNGSVPANTRVNIPLIGYVVLNEQTSNISTALANLTVNMIHIHVTTLNILGLQVGTEIIVSNANSGMVNVFAPAILNGGSFGTEVLGQLLSSAPTAPVILPCLGTSGSLLTSTLASVNLPSILTSGTVTSSGESDITEYKSSGRTTSTVQGLNLLSGLVTANVMTAQVNTVVDDTIQVFSVGTDTFAGISVAGHPEITDNVPYNTSVSLAGLGTLYLKRVIYTPPGIRAVEVRSLELVVNQNNTYGLPIGLDVIVGDALIQVIPDTNP